MKMQTLILLINKLWGIQSRMTEINEKGVSLTFLPSTTEHLLLWPSFIFRCGCRQNMNQNALQLLVCVLISILDPLFRNNQRSGQTTSLNSKKTSTLFQTSFQKGSREDTSVSHVHQCCGCSACPLLTKLHWQKSSNFWF